MLGQQWQEQTGWLRDARYSCAGGITTMAMSIPPNAEAKIRAKVSSGLYATADEAIETAVSLLDEWDRLQSLRASLVEAEEQSREGRVAEWTPELRRKLRQEAEVMALRGIAPDPDVCP
jgi:Arc/MetJ-type ribon-helix-helix transcriptional regulator